tara:strand:- start:127 stop:822 length:696 start_codon:yes stop_codon:yes gene_type:complete
MPVHNLFPTPVYIKQALGSTQKEINEELFNLYDPSNMMKNTHTYNHTSSHEVSCDEEGNMFATNIVKQTPKFTSFLEKCIANFLGELGMRHHIPYAVTESWFTRTAQGKHAPVHSHGNSDISGVYYLQTNGADGELAIRNPLNNCNGNLLYFLTNMSHGEKKMPLKTGLLMMWPATLEHSTYINQTPTDRISISFNITVSRPPFITTLEPDEQPEGSHILPSQKAHIVHGV